MSKNDTISLSRRLLNVSESIEHLANQNYKYTTEMAVSEAFRKAFIKEGILMLIDSTLNSCADGITNVDMRITLINVDNDTDRHVMNWCGQGYDKGDKGMMIPTYNDAEADHMTVLERGATETAPHKKGTGYTPPMRTKTPTTRIQPVVTNGVPNNEPTVTTTPPKKTPILPKKSQALVREILDYSAHPVFDPEQREKLVTWAKQTFNKSHDKSVQEAHQQVHDRVTKYMNTKIDVYLRQCENSNDVIDKGEMDRKISELKENRGVVEWLS